MFVSRVRVDLTSSTSGAVVAYSPILNGPLLSVRYSSGGTLGTTAVLTLTNEGTDEACYTKAIGSAGATVRPRAVVCKSTSGTIYNTTGTANPVTDYFEFANERLKCSIGGTTASDLTGTLLVAMGGHAGSTA